MLGTGVLVVVTSLAGAAGAYWVLHTYNGIARVPDLELDPVVASEPRNYLVVGSDFREGEVEDKRSDSIMVLRVDPATGRAFALSFPRDLQVEIADLGVTGKINSAYNGPEGIQRLIDTLQLNFQIPIHHYVEIDFTGFMGLVDHIGGIPMYFEHAVRNPPPGADGIPDDHDVGLYIPQRGCVTIDGTQALALARSRVLQYRAPEGWKTDLFGDYGRMTRQQIILEQALRKAVRQARTNPVQLTGMVELLADNVTLDASLGLGDLLDLADQFRDFDPDSLQTYALPTDTPDPEGKEDPIPNLVEAEPILDVFRDEPAADETDEADEADEADEVADVDPALVQLTVINGSGVDGQAAEVTTAFQGLGFAVQEPTTAAQPADRTTVLHAPGEAALGNRVARQLSVPALVQPQADLAPGEVHLVTGPDLGTVSTEPLPPDAPTAPDAPTTSTAGPSTSTSTPPPPPPPPTDQVGYPAGQTPPGKSCG